MDIKKKLVKLHRNQQQSVLYVTTNFNPLFEVKEPFDFYLPYYDERQKLKTG